MNEIQSIITERVDDIPLLLAQMQRQELEYMEREIGVSTLGNLQINRIVFHKKETTEFPDRHGSTCPAVDCTSWVSLSPVG
jgi:hypothetical protein